MTRLAIAAAAVVLLLMALRLSLEALAGLSHVAVLLLFGSVIAFVLAPLASAMERRTGRRRVAVAVTALIAALAIVGALTLLTLPLLRETRELVDDLPRYTAALTSDDPISVFGLEISGELKQRVGDEIAARAGELSRQAAAIVLRAGAAVVDLVFVLVLAVYLLAAGPAAHQWVLSVVPVRRRAAFERVEAEARTLFGRYIRGQLLLGLIVGAASAVAYTLLGVPYAVLLGVLAGLLEVVPILGPIVAGAVAVLVALTMSFSLALWVLAVAVVIQQVENNILVPRISGRAVRVHSLAALLAVLIGAELGGIIGAIFAVPLTGLAWSVWRARSTIS